MTAVWVDQYSGQIREVRNALRFSKGETFLTALWPLHTGEIWGGWGHTLYFLSGLFLPLLYLSGLTRWLIGKEAIADRAINLKPLQTWLQDLKKHVIMRVRESLKGQTLEMAALKRRLIKIAAEIQSWRGKKGSGGW
jgi:uncharacterized iron-regulated membrane protein